MTAGTQADNMRDAGVRGRFGDRTGERNANAKLRDGDASLMARLHDQGASWLAIAERFGVHPEHAKRVAGGATS